MGTPADPQYVHQGALGEGDGVLVLSLPQVVGREELIELGEDRVEFAEVPAGGSDEPVTDADVLLTVTLSQRPFYTHQE
jgi:hypothetical protein